MSNISLQRSIFASIFYSINHRLIANHAGIQNNTGKRRRQHLKYSLKPLIYFCAGSSRDAILILLMSHDEFTKLFNYMEGKFGAIDKRFDNVEGDIRDIKIELAEFGGQLKDLREEVAVLSHNDDRQNQWIKELASHTGAKLSPA